MDSYINYDFGFISFDRGDTFVVSNDMILAMINDKDPDIGNMEDYVFNYIVKNTLDNNEELWEEDDWGFYEELSYKMDKEEIFSDVDEDMIQTNVKSDNDNISDFIEYCLGKAEVFFDVDGSEISQDEWKKKIENMGQYVLSICECRADA